MPRAGNSVLMLLRLLRLCGAAEGNCWPGPTVTGPAPPPTLTRGCTPTTDRGEAYNARMAGAIRAAGLPVRFVTPSEYERA